MMERDEVAKTDNLKEWFTGMGFTMKIESVANEFEEIEFCQTHPVLIGEDYRMVRNPRVCVKKDLTAIVRMDDIVVRKQWLHAVGCGGSHLANGVPVLQEFYHKFPEYVHKPNSTKPREPTRYIERVVAGGLAYGFGDCGKNLTKMSYKHPKVDISPETRLSFYLAFGILPDE